MLTTILTILVIIVVFIILFKIFKLLMRVLLVVVFLGIAWLTNPGTSDHCAAVEKKYPDVNGNVKHCNMINYHLFGLTTWNGTDSKVIGAGAFTQVIIFRAPG